MKCKNCGTSNLKGAKFCEKCGVSLIETGKLLNRKESQNIKRNHCNYAKLDQCSQTDTAIIYSDKTTGSLAVLGSPKHMLNDLYNIQAENNGKEK